MRLAQAITEEEVMSVLPIEKDSGDAACCHIDGERSARQMNEPDESIKHCYSILFIAT